MIYPQASCATGLAAISSVSCVCDKARPGDLTVPWLAGTVAFAVTAVLAVVPRGIDIFGVLVMGVITAIPVLVGCASLALVLHYVPEHRAAGAILCGLAIFAFRGAAIHWNLSVPDWLATKTKEQT